MKTVKEWYDLLPEDIRIKAYANTHLNHLQHSENTLNRALWGSFIFSQTPEGQEYWLNAAYLKVNTETITNKIE